jgi:hypothetical protein
MIFCRTGLIVLTCLYYIPFELRLGLYLRTCLHRIPFAPLDANDTICCERHPWKCALLTWALYTLLFCTPFAFILVPARSVREFNSIALARPAFDNVHGSLIGFPSLPDSLYRSFEFFRCIFSSVTPNANSWSWLIVARLSIRFRSSFDCRLFACSRYSLTHNSIPSIMLFRWALLALLARSEGKSERDLAATARQWQVWWLLVKVVAKFMSYNEKLPLAGNCENLRIRIFEFSGLN